MTIRARLRHLTPALVAALAVGMAGCGDEEETRLLSQGRADTLLELLDDAEQQFEDGECEELDGTLSELQQQVSGVSADVDENVRTALASETQELARLTRDCESEEEVVPPPTVPPETIPEETIPETTTEETETETETETAPVEPPDDDGNGGNGKNGGGDNGSSNSGGGVAPPGQEEGGDPPPSAGPPDSGTEGPAQRQADASPSAADGFRGES